MNYKIILFVFIFLLFFICLKVTSNLFIEFFDIDQYKKTMSDNEGKKLYRLALDKKIRIYEEDCEDKCDHTNCIKLDSMKKVLNKCLKCNKQKNKCFKRSIIGGNCDDCNEEDDKIDCYRVANFGCANPYNLQSNNGTQPYYIEIPDNNPNSSYTKKCVFCWNILDNI